MHTSRSLCYSPSSSVSIRSKRGKRKINWACHSAKCYYCRNKIFSKTIFVVVLIDSFFLSIRLFSGYVPFISDFCIERRECVLVIVSEPKWLYVTSTFQCIILIGSTAFMCVFRFFFVRLSVNSTCCSIGIYIQGRIYGSWENQQNHSYIFAYTIFHCCCCYSCNMLPSSPLINPTWTLFLSLFLHSNSFSIDGENHRMPTK